MSFRKRLFVVVDEDSRLGNVFNTLIIFLIVFNMLSIILESVQSLQAEYHWLFEGFENFCLVVFTFEYIIRLATADVMYPNLKGRKPFFKYIFSFMALVDLLSILPSILLLILPQGVLAEMSFIRMLRIMRVFRVFKITRYSNSLKMMGEVLKAKSGELSITIFITMILMIIASTLMYYAEHTTQPDQFPDIVHAFWWAVATLTTVGYGDVYPVTPLGKVLSGVIALLGIGLVALPTGILSSAFVDKMADQKEDTKRLKAEKREAKRRARHARRNGTSVETASAEQAAENGAKEGEPNPSAKDPAQYAAGGMDVTTAEDLEMMLPGCPHLQLQESGHFQTWIKYCPLCGESLDLVVPLFDDEEDDESSEISLDDA